MTPFRDRYEAHARRIDALQRVAGGGPLADYCAGYRAGMVRWLARQQGTEPPDAESRALARLAAEALRGRVADRPRAARGCGYHDGQVWPDVTRHRGLLRVAIGATVPSGSARAFARHVWHVDEASVRQMLAGRRPVPADRYPQLLDLAAGSVDHGAPDDEADAEPAEARDPDAER